MKSFFRKLLLGKNYKRDRSIHGPVKKRILNIKAIWNNDHQDDNGIEKIVRLLLSSSQLLFPGIYIKQLAYNIGAEYDDIAMDLYVLTKVVFPFIILYNNFQNSFFFGSCNDLFFT